MGNAVHTIQWSVSFVAGSFNLIHLLYLVRASSWQLFVIDVFVHLGHHLYCHYQKHHTISTSVAKLVCGAYTSTDWHWISTGVTSFVYNNWITLLFLTFYCVCSRPAIFKLTVWWYSTAAVPCRDWQQTLCMCLLQREIHRWLMLFRMSHTVDLFLKLLCCIRSTLMMNPSGLIYLCSILTEILCGIQFFWYMG